MHDLYRADPWTQKKHVLDRVDNTAPTPQHDLDHADSIDQGFVCPERPRK